MGSSRSRPQGSGADGALRGVLALANGAGEGRGHEDVVHLYLDDIGRHALLDQADEACLGQAIAEGKSAAVQLAGGELPPAERRRLEEKVWAGRVAAARFVTANLRLVVSVAKRYRSSGLALLDLVQEGNLGLMHAVEKFDHKKGFKFSTYATWWIRQAITRGIANSGRTIRLPVHAGEHLLDLKMASAAFEARHGRPPDPSELARAVGMPVSKVNQLLPYTLEPVSLSEPRGDQGDTQLGELVEGPGTQAPDEVVFASMLPAQVAELLARLEEREQQVLCLRYGLDRGEPRTLSEVAEHFGVSRERVRHIEAKALTKLRKSSPAGLRDLISA